MAMPMLKSYLVVEKPQGPTTAIRAAKLAHASIRDRVIIAGRHGRLCQAHSYSSSDEGSSYLSPPQAPVQLRAGAAAPPNQAQAQQPPSQQSLQDMTEVLVAQLSIMPHTAFRLAHAHAGSSAVQVVAAVQALEERMGMRREELCVLCSKVGDGVLDLNMCMRWQPCCVAARQAAHHIAPHPLPPSKHARQIHSYQWHALSLTSPTLQHLPHTCNPSTPTPPTPHTHLQEPRLLTTPIAHLSHSLHVLGHTCMGGASPQDVARAVHLHPALACTPGG